MRSRWSSLKKVMAIEPRVAQVRHAANVDSHTHQENAQHGAKNVTSVETKIILLCVVGTRDRKDSLDRDQHILTHRESQSKRRSRSRHRRYASEDSEDRSRSRSTTQSAHSIEQNSLSRPSWSPWETTQWSLWETPLWKQWFCNRRHFTAISRLKSVASISNYDRSRWQNQDHHNSEHQATTPEHGIDNSKSQSWWWCRG